MPKITEVIASAWVKGGLDEETCWCCGISKGDPHYELCPYGVLADMPSQTLDVLEERKRQDAEWGEQNHPDEWYLAILVEEVGEAAKAMLEWHFGYPGARKEDIRKELVEASAVALAMVECFDRREQGAR